MSQSSRTDLILASTPGCCCRKLLLCLYLCSWSTMLSHTCSAQPQLQQTGSESVHTGSDRPITGEDDLKSPEARQRCLMDLSCFLWTVSEDTGPGDAFKDQLVL